MKSLVIPVKVKGLCIPRTEDEFAENQVASFQFDSDRVFFRLPTAGTLYCNNKFQN